MWYVIYLKISVSKHSHVICLLIGFWGRCTHFRLLFGYLTAVGHHRTIEGRLGRENICGGVAMDDVLDKNTCQIIYRRRAMGFPTLIFYVISGGFGVPLWLLNMKWPLSHIWFGGLILCYDGLQWSNSQIDARNEFSEPKNLWKDISHGYILKLIFLDSFGGLWWP